MGSRRAARPSRSHARPRGGLRARGAALALGAVTVTAGVGITLAVAGGEDEGAADRVATSAAGEASHAGDASGGAAPLASASARPSATASGSPSASAGPKDDKDRAKTKTKDGGAPERTTSPAARPTTAAAAPARTTAKSGGDRSSGGGGDTGSGSTGAGSGSGSGSGGSGGPEAQVLALVNEERAAAGCSPVTANDRLTRAADDYSDVMASSGVMSHTGPDGSTMASRVEAAGYQWSALGENIARGQADAASVMESWMNSSGHRANILNCSFKELGVGVHFGDGGPWWTQDFGTGR
ncbi:putative membrane protein [Streptomyces ambofaciens ATCC 23877]|uniref:Putative membrane protein n=1 Tax=Streptomyces ambofaciens (strain ATCC 23877 / 3486 / DSM 40053 / JCM 4204 / NBRC 12836 / NRRL B-2516) TaxID=278992 RepID=A0ACW5_STRA7|nr:CAP domain-containing protein [Streptomyces ambofaciens]AKZ60019.1 putative membrane protein [Streptomyces ambofaciens ATCC 23877]CAJ88320.1 putative membrane protein [Streptomyces ambofaciens ATCC 23877]